MKRISSIRKNGLLQQQRHLASLFPKNNPIDDKDIYSVYRYMYSLSPEINFYNSNNVIDGNWQDFFTANINLVLFLNSRDIYSANLTRFENLQMAIQLAENDDAVLSGAKNMFEFLQSGIQVIKDIHQQFKNNVLFEGPVQGILSQVDDFDSFFEEIKLIYLGYKKEFGKDFKIPSDFKNVEITGEHRSEFSFDKEAITTREKVNSSLHFLRQILDQIRIKFSGFLGAVQYYLKSYSIINENNPPHIALLIAFIHLYQHLQDQLNGTTQKHLDFFYSKVLNLAPLQAEPDTVAVFFENDAQTVIKLIHKDQMLKAEIKGGKYLLYSVNNDTVITKAAVKAMNMLYVAREIWYENSMDEFFELNPYQYSTTLPEPEIIFKNPAAQIARPIFGEDQNKLVLTDRSMERTLVQTLIASPVLYLEEGDRYIVLSIYIEPKSAEALNSFINNYTSIKNLSDAQHSFDFDQVSYELFNDAFTVEYTGRQTWCKIKKQRFLYSKDTGILDFKLELAPEDAAFTEYNEIIHGGIAGVNLPALRVTINSTTFINPISFLNRIQVSRVKIHAGVIGATKFRFQNNIGLLSSVYAFQPFGPQPLPGSFLEIQNTNVFNKYLKFLQFDIDWMGLPEIDGGFTEYYKDYNLNITNSSFKVNLSATKGSNVTPENKRQQELQLFSTVRNAEGHEYLNSRTVLTDIDLLRLELAETPLLSADAAVTNSTIKQATLRLELTSPAAGFGSKVYPPLFTEVAVHNNRRFVSKRLPPNEPYIPVIKDFLVDYMLEHAVAITSGNHKNDDGALKIFHVHPFGWQQSYPSQNANALTLFPVIDVERNLDLGIADVTPGQPLSLYFHLADNTMIDKADNDIVINWSYLDNNVWKPVSDSSIFSDTTGGMINSGIITIKMPDDVITGNTILPAGLSWLRASLAGFSELKSQIISVYTNAVTATRLETYIDGEYINSIPPFTIKSFETKVQGIKKITQPFNSVNGRQCEKTDEFYVRVSERLRHKDRPVTCLDIEQYVLQEFPQLLMAKCVSGTESEYTDSDFRRYTVQVIVIPDTQNLSPAIKERPRASMALLYDVRELLKHKLSQFIMVEVANPVYEEVKLKFTVSFSTAEGQDYQYNLNKLNQDIKTFFCPWLTGQVAEIKIGSKIFVSDILSYLKSLSYVTSVSKFSAVHFYSSNNQATNEVTYQVDDLSSNAGLFMQASVPGAILVPSGQHLISVTNTFTGPSAATIGIGDMVIGNEFLVTDTEAADFSLPAYEFKNDSEHFNLTITL